MEINLNNNMEIYDYGNSWWWLWGLKEYVLERFKTGQWGRILNINYSFSIIKN